MTTPRSDDYVADPKLGKEGADKIFDLFRSEFRAMVVKTPEPFAHVDAVAITAVPQAAFFIECMARSNTKGRYQDTMFGKLQYEKIETLFKETGFSTYLVMAFTDAIGYLILPAPRAITRTEGTKVYLDVAKFTWLDPEVAGRYLG